MLGIQLGGIVFQGQILTLNVFFWWNSFLVSKMKAWFCGTHSRLQRRPRERMRVGAIVLLVTGGGILGPVPGARTALWWVGGEQERPREHVYKSRAT